MCCFLFDRETHGCAFSSHREYYLGCPEGMLYMYIFSPIKMLTTYALGKIDVCLLWSTVLCKICIVIYHIRKIIQFV